MAKNDRIFNLPETKGSFQLKGKVSGTSKDTFYVDKKTKTGKDMRRINFGVEYDSDETLYVSMQGLPQEKVYFSKRAEKKGEKPDTISVPWEERHTFSREGYKLIGKNIGVKKKVDKEGKTVNDKKILTDFDACKEVNDYLKDDTSVFIRGNLDYSSFIDDKGNKKVSIKLSPSQISLCSDVDYNADDFQKQNDFTQVIVFTGIEQEKNDDDKPTGRFLVSAKIVTYKTIENVEYIITDSKLANLFKKNLKPYNAIQVSGHMISSKQVKEVSEEDNWGEENVMEKVTAPTKREFIITGAKPSTIEKEKYSQENIEDALSKIAQSNKVEEEFGKDSDNTDWGKVGDFDDNEDDEPWD